MLVFRELRRTVDSARLIRTLLADLAAIRSATSPETLQQALESALLSAGDLECGIHDSQSSSEPPRNPDLHLSRRLTEVLARAIVGTNSAERRALSDEAEDVCRQLRCPLTFSLSPPEGFCFYALHPLAYAELAQGLSLKAGSAAVIGIRTIGTTLSAVVAAALQSKLGEGSIGRITVRPIGHPYGRTTTFDDDALAFLRAHRRKDSIFLVVDEGPGLSGSSFLSVGEALHELGIPHERIIFLSSREVDPEALVAENAAARWRKFRSHAVAPQPPSNTAGNVRDWREHVFLKSAYDSCAYRNPRDWPAVWTSMSAPKYFLPNFEGIYKFEGLGSFGSAVRERATRVAAAGFGPAPTAVAGGYSSYPIAAGKLLSPQDKSEALFARMAQYLAFRLKAFLVDPELADQSALEQMVRFNFSQIIGEELHGAFHLELARPVIADARMMPHEWMRLESGEIWKLDSAAHGDNHFFPGPTDIAWDLAGAIIEWQLQLEGEAAEAFLQTYQQLTGDSPEQRLPDYMIAYTAFHAGYARMAAASVGEEEERARLLRDYERYRKWLVKLAERRSHSQAVRAVIVS
jgi:hypothetical protein